MIGWKSLTWFHVFSTISGCWSRFFTICGKDAIFSNSKNYTWFLILALFSINIQLSKNAQNSAAIRELKCRPRGTLAVPRLLRFSISDHWLVFTYQNFHPFPCVNGTRTVTVHDLCVACTKYPTMKKIRSPIPLVFTFDMRVARRTKICKQSQLSTRTV